MRALVAGFACLLAAACGSQEAAFPAEAPELVENGTSAAPPQPDGMSLQVSGSGIGWTGSGSSIAIAFGASRAEIDTALSAALDAAAEKSANDECGAGPIEFSRYGAFTANFQDDAFVGWSLDGESDIATGDGLTIGSPRGQVAAVRGYEPILQSTLGEEFMVGDISGLFGEDGVERLWAGTNCIFR